MIYFAKPVLTEDLYIVKKEKFSLTCLCAIRTLDERPSIFIREKFILSSERMLHKNYDCQDSVAKKISGRKPQGAWRQDELIGGKPSVVK
jgi:hypothetical protein